MVQFEDANAYWISPDCKIFPVTKAHINDVIDAPSVFGLSSEDIRRVFKKYREPLNFEGYARQEIMLGLLQKGWIRIRYVPKEDNYTVQLRSLTKKAKECIWKWAVELVKVNKNRRYSVVDVLGLDGAGLCVYSVEDISKQALFNKRDLLEGTNRRLVFLKSVLD